MWACPGCLTPNARVSMAAMPSPTTWFVLGTLRMVELILAKGTVEVGKNVSWICSESHDTFSDICLHLKVDTKAGPHIQVVHLYFGHNISFQVHWHGLTQIPPRSSWLEWFRLESVRRNVKFSQVAQVTCNSAMFFFPGCAQAGYPGVYAEVSSVLDWVNSYVSLCGSTDPTPTNEPPTGCARKLTVMNLSPFLRLQNW